MYGRLGNSMLGYAILLSMKQNFAFRTFLNDQALNELKKYFVNIDEQLVKPLDAICPQNCNWTDYLYSPKSLAFDPILSKGHTISYLDDVSRKSCLLKNSNT